jgi:hypothetical protein
MNAHPEHRLSRWASITAAVTLTVAASLASAQQPASTPKPAPAAQQRSVSAENLVLLTAKITAIDATKRLVTLKTAAGREETVEAGADVRNFAQLKVGDDVDIRYYQSLAAALAPATAGNEATVGAARAPAGASPAGGAGVQVTAVVTVNSVDAAKGFVSFTGPEGKKRETTAQTDAGKKFVAGLKPGDRVQITYTEALAVSVAPAAK